MRQIIPGVALVLVGTQALLASIFFAAMRSAFEWHQAPRRTRRCRHEYCAEIARSRSNCCC